MSQFDNPKHQIFVGYLPDEATMDDVEDLFKPFGNVKSINLKPGYGFVTFDEEEHAQKALQDLGRDTTICGKRIDIQPARVEKDIKSFDRRNKDFKDSFSVPQWAKSGKNNRDNDGRSGGPIIRDMRRKRSRSRSRGRGRSNSRGRSRSKSPIYRRQPRILTDFCLKVTNLTTRASWQDLKDFIRKETDVETAFCEAHRVKVREGLVALRSSNDMKLVQKYCDNQMINPISSKTGTSQIIFCILLFPFFITIYSFARKRCQPDDLHFFK
ncbi:unnamed protein product [Oikopleura dioica]|uniref:RRM domain-containing protein n=1 Tax=Oikopleura dioica TaxID=34765 RepID=E4YEE2_OIKDI|nr:unnamed protein product [Oikopleura dioica]